MKNIINRFICIIFFSIFMIMTASHNGFSQSSNSDDLDPFLILIETTPRGWISLTCKDGCRFVRISYNPRKNRPQGIDNTGMCSDIREMNISNGEFANYFFTITVKDEELYLEGLEGTSWSELTINCPEGNCFQYIDQNGLVVKAEQ